VRAGEDRTTAPLPRPPDTVIACDHNLERYREAFDSGIDPKIVAKWISDTEAKKAKAQFDLTSLGAGSAPLVVSDASRRARGDLARWGPQFPGRASEERTEPRVHSARLSGGKTQRRVLTGAFVFCVLSVPRLGRSSIRATTQRIRGVDVDRARVRVGV
jgi:hypothetical protein